MALKSIHQVDKHLNDEQKYILKEFIKNFIPKRGNKRKHSDNELDYLSQAIAKTIRKYFGFHASTKHILDAFIDLDYSVYTRNGIWDGDKKETKPSQKGTLVRWGEGYNDYRAAFIYIDVDPKIIRQFMRTIYSLLPNTGQDKIREILQIRVELENFKNRVLKNNLSQITLQEEVEREIKRLTNKSF